MLPLPTVRKLLRECFPEEQLSRAGIIRVSEAEFHSTAITSEIHAGD